MSFIADPPDNKIPLLKGILAGIGGVADAADAPDTGTQILQSIAQTYGQSVTDTADTELSLLRQWINGLGITYDPALQTEVECLKVIYIDFGGANDATMPDHEIPLLKFIHENASPPGPAGYILLEDGSYILLEDGGKIQLQN